MAGNERLIDRPQKTDPQGTDFVYVADMEANPVGNEVKVLINDIINTELFVTEPTPIPAGNVPICNGSNTIIDSGIKIAGQNITGTSTLTLSGAISAGNQAVTKTYADTKLAIANNLSDVASAITSRSNLGLGNAAVKTVTDNTQSNVVSAKGAFTIGHILIAADVNGTAQDGGEGGLFLIKTNNLSDVSSTTTSFNNISPLIAKGDVIGFDGSSNVRIPPSTDGFIFTLDSTQPTGIKWAPVGPASGFVDNALFISNNGMFVGLNVNLNIGLLSAFTIGNTWTANPDNVSITCNQAGTYSFSATIPYYINTVGGGAIVTQFSKNGVLRGNSNGPINTINPLPSNNQSIWTASINDIITCIPGTVIRLNASCGASPPPALYYQATICTGVSLLITRLT
jgi:hypothetical protein